MPHIHEPHGHAAIAVSGLSKRFGEVAAVESLDFSVAAGSALYICQNIYLVSYIF